MLSDPVLECQECGEVIRELSQAEAQFVAQYPERFASAMCRACRVSLLGVSLRFKNL